ncbi:protein kinase family protein [Kineococcus rubinsiae]|uniref:protein kinase family protein n=1 Tax=Kineococcus rubinsiae TaxID=2609562 RepID=UPI00142F4944|nr:protein kinase family protein [Kineococcus rubinsiae]NIZ90683.1 hypothetical protein [Kineococcus rubinsiae]
MEHEGDVLDAVGRSTVADRYALDGEPGGAPDARPRRARDTTLDRWVRVRTLDAADARAAEFLDAARRAAMVSDPHVPRVLDAGTDQRPGGGTVYVVEEDVEGRTLTDLLRQGPLQAPAVRSLVGEVATALDAAARRGLHHTRLTPDSVVLGPDGVVRVVGLGLEAALEKDPPVVSAARATVLANRADAVGLVALVYAGLTGRWPAAAGIAAHRTLPAAPSGDGHPVPPKDIRPDVPNDLDTLCVVTFGPHEDGPRDPSELALQLAPWSMAVWADVLRDMRGERATREVRQRLASREVVPDEEPPVPFAAPASTGRPPQSDSRLVLAIVAVCVVVGLVVALWQLSRIGVPGELSGQPAATSSAAPSTPAAESPAAPAPSTTPPPAAPAPVPLRVAGVTAIDPEGDGTSPGGVERTVDGDPASSWSSERYTSAGFGGLKSGIGLLVDLGADVDVTSVVLTDAGEGGRVELRNAPTGGYEGSVPVAESAAGGVATLTPLTPVRTRTVLLWVTQLPTTDGQARLTVSELQVLGTPVP